MQCALAELTHMVFVSLLHLHLLVLQLTLSRAGLKALFCICGLSALAPLGCWHHHGKIVHCVRGSLSLSAQPYLASPGPNLSIHQYQLALPLHNPSCQRCPLVTAHPPSHLLRTMLVFDQVLPIADCPTQPLHPHPSMMLFMTQSHALTVLF